MMSGFVLVNGEFYSSEAPVLPAHNRGFKFGDGIFESMRMRNAKLQFAEQHADRLIAGMKALKLDGYALYDEFFLRQICNDLAKKNKLGSNARFRLGVYRDGGGLYSPQSNKPGYVLEGTSLNDSNYELNSKGLIVDVFDEMTKHVDKFSNYKTTNALLYVMAGLYQKNYRLDEAIILNNQGFLCESTSSNVFVVYQGSIYTPALTEGCVGGVMRSAVIQLGKMNDLQVIEAQISPEILKEADEVFLTNASSGIRWVMGYGKKRYFNEMSKFLSSKLNLL